MKGKVSGGGVGAFLVFMRTVKFVIYFSSIPQNFRSLNLFSINRNMKSTKSCTRSRGILSHGLNKNCFSGKNSECQQNL